MLEFALLLPFLVLLAFSSFEVYKTFQARQFLSLVSREVGNEAARSCLSMPTGADACLLNIANRVVDDSTEPGSPLRDTKVIVRIFKYPTATYSAEAVRDPKTWTEFVSRYDASRVSGMNSFTSAVGPTVGAIVTTEVFYKQPSFARAFTGTYYETTIF